MKRKSRKRRKSSSLKWKWKGDINKNKTSQPRMGMLPQKRKEILKFSLLEYRFRHEGREGLEEEDGDSPVWQVEGGWAYQEEGVFLMQCSEGTPLARWTLMRKRRRARRQGIKHSRDKGIRSKDLAKSRSRKLRRRSERRGWRGWGEQEEEANEGI